MYPLTTEQQDIISTAIAMYENSLSVYDNILKVEAVAGASKTYTLIKVAEAIPHTSQLYLAYNKSIAEESKSVFPNYVECKTTHSLAYTPIVKFGLDSEGNSGKSRTVGIFNYRSILEDIPYDEKLLIVDYLEGFYVSAFVYIEEYLQSLSLDPKSLLPKLVMKYYYQMEEKVIPCTHAYYLKAYHILLATDCIHYDKPFDLLMLDEAGDINAVTLEIFKLLPAKLKLMVGDSLQNIYSFNGTINGFKALKSIGVTRHLSQSFRCSTAIAERIENFCQRYLEPDTVFRGTVHTDTTVRTEAILSRTNSGLISHMITLAEANIPFNTTRAVSEIFSTMLMLMNLKKDATIYDPRYKHIMQDLKTFYASTVLQHKFKYPIMYIKSLYEAEDMNIKIAIQTILKYKSGPIYNAYKYAKECEINRKEHAITLSTVHSSKGLTFDKVTIANDFDIDKILQTAAASRTADDIENLRLYYVAASRARLVLLGAEALDI